KAAGLITKNGVAKLSVVGIGMRSHSGVAARLFDCLGKAGINIQLISTSEIKIAVVIDEADVERAAQLTHAEFGLAAFAVASATSPSAQLLESGDRSFLKSQSIFREKICAKRLPQVVYHAHGVGRDF